MNTLQKIFVEQMPMIPVGADNVGGGVQHEELDRLAGRRQPVRRRRSRPSPTRWTSSCTSSPPS